MAQAQMKLHTRPPRWECTGPIAIVDDCGRELMGNLGNMSDDGFMADCEEKMRLGSVIRTTLPDHGAVNAEVRWALGWRFGALILRD